MLRSAHVEKKDSSKWALLKHVTRRKSIGTCSSELYIFSLLKLPPPPRAAILVCIPLMGFQKSPKNPESQKYHGFLRVLGGKPPVRLSLFQDSPTPRHLCGTFLRFGHLLRGPVVVRNDGLGSFGLGLGNPKF